MMFSIIRIAIGFFFLLLSIGIIVKSNSKHKLALGVIFAILAATLSFSLSFLPFENLFVNFDSPKASYEYYTIGKSNQLLVVEGNTCDFLIDQKKDSNVCLIIPKSNKGWKIGIGSNTKQIAQKITDGIFVSVYQYKNTKDYFLLIYDVDGDVINLSDDYNTIFYSMERNNDFLKKTFVTYYAYVPDFESQYCIKANDISIVLREDKGTVLLSP